MMQIWNKNLQKYILYHCIFLSWDPSILFLQSYEYMIYEIWLGTKMAAVVGSKNV